MTIAARHQACRDASTARSVTEHRSGETSTELAARLLAEAPQRDWRLRDLAALVHLSVSQLGRAFTLRFGMPPMRYLAHIRAHRLAHLLVETDLPIGVAMTKVGWRSRGHAARQFTDVVGTSPSEYRRTAIGALSRRPVRGHQQRRAAPNQKAPSRQECRDAVGENLAWADVVRRVEPRIGRSLVRVNGDALLVRRHGCGQRGANHQVGQSVGSSQRIRGTRLFEQDAHPLGKGRGPWQDPILPGCAEPG